MAVIREEDLAEAVDRGIITRQQAEDLLRLFAGRTSAETGGDESLLSIFLYYFGALVVIGAMGWFMNTAWSMFGGGGLTLIAAVYAGAFIAASRYFREKAPVLGGLLVVMAVCMTPLAVYGMQKLLGFLPLNHLGEYRDFYMWRKSGWFYMEVATLIAGLASLRFARIPFAMAPVAFVLWFMSMDITPLLFGPDHHWTYHKYVSIAFGVLMLAAAIIIDRRERADYASWLYIFGTMAFWGGLSLLRSDSEINKALYCLVNVVMMFGGVLLERNVMLIFGALGVFGYIGHLAWTVFRDSLFFPLALSLVGLGILYAGWLFNRRKEAVVRFVQSVIPRGLIHLLPKNRR